MSYIGKFKGTNKTTNRLKLVAYKEMEHTYKEWHCYFTINKHYKYVKLKENNY